MSSAFKKAANKKSKDDSGGNLASPGSSLLPGTKRWIEGVLFVSSGHAVIDKILGGGVPLGTSILIEEDVMTGDHARTLARLFAAEGVACGHHTVVAGGDGRKDLSEFLPDLPFNASRGSVDFAAVAAGLTRKIGDNAEGNVDEEGDEEIGETAEAAEVEESSEDPDGDGLKIAWQYKKYLVEKSTAANDKSSGSSGTSTRGYCHTFDLNRRIPKAVLDASPCSVLDVINSDPFPHANILAGADRNESSYGIIPITTLVQKAQQVMMNPNGIAPALDGYLDALNEFMPTDMTSRRARILKKVEEKAHPTTQGLSAQYYRSSTAMNLVKTVLEKQAVRDYKEKQTNKDYQTSFQKLTSAVATSLIQGPLPDPIRMEAQSHLREQLGLPLQPPEATEIARVVVPGLGGPLWTGCLGSDVAVSCSVPGVLGLLTAPVYGQYLPMLEQTRRLTELIATYDSTGTKSNATNSTSHTRGAVLLATCPTWCLPLSVAQALRSCFDIVVKIHSFVDPAYGVLTKRVLVNAPSMLQGTTAASTTPLFGNAKSLYELSMPSSATTAPEFKDFSGLLLVRRFLKSGSLSLANPLDTLTWVYKLDRRRFTVEKPHLPPELDEKATVDTSAMTTGVLAKDATTESNTSSSAGGNGVAKRVGKAKISLEYGPDSGLAGIGEVEGEEAEGDEGVLLEASQAPANGTRRKPALTPGMACAKPFLI